MLKCYKNFSKNTCCIFLIRAPVVAYRSGQFRYLSAPDVVPGFLSDITSILAKDKLRKAKPF